VRFSLHWLLPLACVLLACDTRPDGRGSPAEPAVRAPAATTRETAPAALSAAGPIVLMWQVQQTGPDGDFALLKSLGVTAVQASRLASWPDAEVSAYLDGAAREGLAVIVYLGIFRQGTGADCAYTEAASRFIASWKSHSAIFAWHSLDEPAGHGITADCQRALYRAIKRQDPERPVMLSTNNADDESYAKYFAEDAFDIYEVHKYVNPRPDDAQRRLIELLRAHRTGDYPVIVTLRAYNAPHKPLRREMTSGSFREQYEFFIEEPGLTRNFGFYGWDLSPNRGIKNDPEIRADFVAFMEARLREPGQRLR
jgi:hypothetical protein